LLDLDYAERQLVVVRRDEVVAEQRVAASDDARRDATPLRSAMPYMAAASVAVPLVASMLLPAVGVAAIVSAGAALTQKRADGSSQIRAVVPIRVAEAAPLRLPLGHPLFDTVYAGHPARPEVYYPLADFHRRAFEHKFTEALKLVTSLGAASIKVSAVQGWGRDFSAGLRVGLPTADSVDGSGKSASSHKREFLYEAELDGCDAPVVPAGLVWYPHEDSWQEVARQRLEHGLRSFELHVTYQDDFTITADVAASVEKVGLKVGGQFERQQSTVWAINGIFPR
jgi:hypothetical protein